LDRDRVGVEARRRRWLVRRDVELNPGENGRCGAIDLEGPLRLQRHRHGSRSSTDRQRDKQTQKRTHHVPRRDTSMIARRFWSGNNRLVMAISRVPASGSACLAAVFVPIRLDDDEAGVGYAVDKGAWLTVPINLPD